MLVVMRRKRALYIGIVLLVVAGWAAGAFFVHWHKNPQPLAAQTSPVPASIRSVAPFPVYYPEQKSLPPGYKLDVGSFSSPVKNGVAYKVTYDGAKQIVFSVQAKPSDSELQTFNSNYIPLRIDYQTPVGQAEIGAYHNGTLVSLPVINGPWIIITAPPDIDQGQLKQVLRSMRS